MLSHSYNEKHIPISIYLTTLDGSYLVYGYYLKIDTFTLYINNIIYYITYTEPY